MMFHKLNGGISGFWMRKNKLPLIAWLCSIWYQLFWYSWYSSGTKAGKLVAFFSDYFMLDFRYYFIRSVIDFVFILIISNWLVSRRGRWCRIRVRSRYTCARHWSRQQQSIARCSTRFALCQSLATIVITPRNTRVISVDIGFDLKSSRVRIMDVSYLASADNWDNSENLSQCVWLCHKKKIYWMAFF